MKLISLKISLRANTFIRNNTTRSLVIFGINKIDISYCLLSNGQIYIQIDGVAMGSPLAPLLADIFMIELERSLIPNLQKITFWRRYVDDTICLVKIGSIEYVRSVLNSFHKNIQFTYECESNAKLSFLDMLLM